MVVSTGLALVACGIALFAFLNAGSGSGQVALTLIVLSTGMGMAMVPATNAIMGALPLGKAGVGSAVNDTSQEIGNALGVAVLGSVLAAGYRAAIDRSGILASLPASIKTLVHDSIGDATVIASHLGGAPGQAIANAARSAFISGMISTVLIAAGISLCGALVALIFLPSKRQAARAGDLTEPAGPTTMKDEKEETLVQ